VSTAELLVLPDAEVDLVAFLKAQPELAELTGRIYTVFPSQAGGDPLLVVRRYGGEPIVRHPLVYEGALLQVEVYGGSKYDVARLGALVRALLDFRSPADVAAYRFIPDETFNPPRPRALVDVTWYLRPASPVAARRSRVSRSSEPIPVSRGG
jgi:hypothetical protein